MNIQQLIDKQIGLIVELQTKNHFLKSEAQDRMAALASAIAGLRDLDLINRRQSQNHDSITKS